MLKERMAVIRNALLLVDLLVIGLAFQAALLLYPLFSDKIITAQSQGIALVLTAPLGALLLYFSDVFIFMRTRTYREIVWAILKSALITFLAFETIIFLFGLTAISRLFYFLFAGLSLLVILTEKTGLFLVAHLIRRRSMNTRQMLIVGTGPRAVDFIRRIDAHPEWGFVLLGAIDDEPGRGVMQVDRLQVIGTIDDMARVFRAEAVDEVVFAVPRSRLSSLTEAIQDCETEGIPVTICVDLFHLRLAKASVSVLDGLPLLRFKTTKAKEWQLLVKRIFDLAVSLLGIVVFGPVMLAVAALIKATSPGPVFFKQARLGLHGRRFTLLKFRTMRRGAHDILSQVDDLNDMSTPEFRSKKTGWITPVGRVLRKFSLDELPQLFNVLLGHMSLVGPRPTVPDEVDKYQTWQRRRFSMKPGITCLWQVKGRNKIGFEDWMKLDMDYMDHWSLKLDMLILLRTIPVVLFGRGAY